jgi:hypothetical protein
MGVNKWNNLFIGVNNDAKILRYILDRHPIISPYLRAGDHVVLDRGFRDIIEELHEYRIKTHMPELMDQTDDQFSTAQGNESRRVTLVRWVVEAANGRIKKKFKLFRNTVQAGICICNLYKYVNNI